MQPAPPEEAVVVLDNKGGMAHGGRRVMLYKNEKFSASTYTDIVQRQPPPPVFGSYRFSRAHQQLTLVYPQGRKEVLHFVPYEGVEYWVDGEDQKLARHPGKSGDSLRNHSLRVVPR